MRLAAIALFALAIISALGACSKPPASERFLQDPQALKRGKGLFIGTCGAYCHSTRKDNRDAPYLFDCEWRHGGSDTEIFNTISTGVSNTRMVGFAGKLPDGEDDIWKIVAFLRASREPCG